MSPNDLAPLWTLVEAVHKQHSHACRLWLGHNCSCAVKYLPAAREALKRMEEQTRMGGSQSSLTRDAGMPGRMTAWEYRWASITGAHSMPAPEELEWLGYKAVGSDPRYGTILYRREVLSGQPHS